MQGRGEKLWLRHIFLSNPFLGIPAKPELGIWIGVTQLTSAEQSLLFQPGELGFGRNDAGHWTAAGLFL